MSNTVFSVGSNVETEVQPTVLLLIRKTCKSTTVGINGTGNRVQVNLTVDTVDYYDIFLDIDDERSVDTEGNRTMTTHQTESNRTKNILPNVDGEDP